MHRESPKRIPNELDSLNTIGGQTHLGVHELSETKSYYLNIVISGIFPYSTGEFITRLKGEMPDLFDDKALSM